MDHTESEMMRSERETPQVQQPGLITLPGPGYRRPRVVPIGTATELVRENSRGKELDGSGGWYVWGS